MKNNLYTILVVSTFAFLSSSISPVESSQENLIKNLQQNLNLQAENNQLKFKFLENAVEEKFDHLLTAFGNFKNDLAKFSEKLNLQTTETCQIFGQTPGPLANSFVGGSSSKHIYKAKDNAQGKVIKSGPVVLKRLDLYNYRMTTTAKGSYNWLGWRDNRLKNKPLRVSFDVKFKTKPTVKGNLGIKFHDSTTTWYSDWIEKAPINEWYSVEIDHDSYDGYAVLLIMDGNIIDFEFRNFIICTRNEPKIGY